MHPSVRGDTLRPSSPYARSQVSTATAPTLRVAPDPGDPRLTRAVTGTDQTGAPVDLRVVEERPLTIYLNAREIVTVMTIGDHPRWLALGFLVNQGMVTAADEVTAIDHDEELETVVVRTARETDHEAKLARATRTSGCAVGTVFGDMMEGLHGLTLPPTPLRVSDLHTLSAAINRTPSLYLEAGAIHGTCLCAGPDPLAYFEDVGRHNAVDKLAGWMRATGTDPSDKTLYTTGRLTSEMVIKCALMGIPSLVSRSGFTAWGVQIARQVGLTVIGRMKGTRFVCLSGADRVVWDAPSERRRMIQPHGLILAGGRATRMGGGDAIQVDKGRLMVHDRSLVARVIDALAPQVDRLALNANGDPARWADLNLPVLPDTAPDHPGPLAGVLAGLDWAAALDCPHIVTAAADTPFLPPDLVPRLLAAAGPTGLALAATQESARIRPQPTFGLWPTALRHDLRRALAAGTRKILQWTDRHAPGLAIFPTTPWDPFFNVNTPEDLARAEAMA